MRLSSGQPVAGARLSLHQPGQPLLELGRTDPSGILVAAALIGTFMSLNFHMAMGATAPWAISPDPNDQGVDLDSLMMIMQFVLVSVSVGAIWWLRRAARQS